MKKEYMKPEMKVFKMQHQSPLLQASVETLRVVEDKEFDPNTMDAI